MTDLSDDGIGALLRPYLAECTGELLSKLRLYLDLLLRWNARTNLTSIRDPREIVTRHFGESLFAAQRVGNAASLLDYGSGAGFPGIPIALLRPEVRVTLGESQGKKASFLREAVRLLELSTDVWSGRVEEMAPETSFDCVTLRSVDGMVVALAGACKLSNAELILFTTYSGEAELVVSPDFELAESLQLPESTARLLLRYVRKGRDVPRETRRF